MARAAGAALAAAALCGCSITERLPGLVDLESMGSVQPSPTAKAEADAPRRPRDDRLIDVAVPVTLDDR